MSQTFPQYVLSTYGKSIYQIRLEVAVAYFIAHSQDDTPFMLEAEEAWQAADAFGSEMYHSQFIPLTQSPPGSPSASTPPGSLASSAFRPGLESVEPTG